MPGRPNRSQFEDLMLPHLDAAYNIACWLLRDAHEAEDAVRDAYLKAYQALPQYRGGSSAAWLLKIVRNTCLTMLRRRKGRSNVIVLRDMLSDDDPLLRSALRDVTSVPERQAIAKAEQEAEPISGLDVGVAREGAVRMRALHLAHIPARMILLPRRRLHQGHARADIGIGQVGMLCRALAFGLVVDLHDLVTAGPIVELDAVDGEAVHVQRPLIGKGAANHENEGGWGHGTSSRRPAL